VGAAGPVGSVLPCFATGRAGARESAGSGVDVGVAQRTLGVACCGEHPWCARGPGGTTVSGGSTGSPFTAEGTGFARGCGSARCGGRACGSNLRGASWGIFAWRAGRGACGRCFVQTPWGVDGILAFRVPLGRSFLRTANGLLGDVVVHLGEQAVGGGFLVAAGLVGPLLRLVGHRWVHRARHPRRLYFRGSKRRWDGLFAVGEGECVFRPCAFGEGMPLGVGRASWEGRGRREGGLDGRLGGGLHKVHGFERELDGRRARRDASCVSRPNDTLCDLVDPAQGARVEQHGDSEPHEQGDVTALA